MMAGCLGRSGLMVALCGTEPSLTRRLTHSRMTSWHRRMHGTVYDRGALMKVRLRDNSGSRLYRYLVEDLDRHGRTRIYFRRKGQPKIVLKETPGTPAFEAEYQRAFSDVSQPRLPIRTPVM